MKFVFCGLALFWRLLIFYFDVEYVLNTAKKTGKNEENDRKKLLIYICFPLLFHTPKKNENTRNENGNMPKWASLLSARLVWLLNNLFCVWLTMIILIHFIISTLRIFEQICLLYCSFQQLFNNIFVLSTQ